MSKRDPAVELKKPRKSVMEARSEMSSAEELEVFILELSTLKEKDLEVPISEIVFQGFKPREFLLACQRLADSAGISREQNKKNLFLLGMVCALRGSKLSKVLQSFGTSGLLKQALTRLRATYKIVEGRPSSPIAVTLPRCLAVTAIPVSNSIFEEQTGKATLLISPEEVTPGFPIALCITHAGALLPPTVTTSDEMAKAVAYAQSLMSLRFVNKANKHQIMQFVLISAKSNLWNTDFKH